MKFEVRWETSQGAFGVKVAEEDVRVQGGELAVVSCGFTKLDTHGINPTVNRRVLEIESA